MKLLSRGNRKLNHWVWSLPAGETCPSAGKCKKGCYALQGCYAFRRAKEKRQRNLEATRQGLAFVNNMTRELLGHRTSKVVRIHDSGDFYDSFYLDLWLMIALVNPSHTFYCYTKEVKLFKEKENAASIPPNFHYIFSFGGLQDALIDVKKDRFCKVFKEEIPDGYIDLGKSDLPIYQEGIDIQGDRNKFGIVYHGKKKGEMEL